MKFRNVLFSLAIILLLSGCGGRWSTGFDQMLDPNISQNWRVVSVDVVVPETLSISNANNLAPDADIVWHGDPEGDRREQVAQVLEAGILRGSSSLRGGVPVHIVVILEQFHALSPRARRIAPSAVHNIRYTIRVFDNRNGGSLTAPVVVDADIEAFVGAQATAANAAGQTQKVRIINHIAAVTAGWLGVGPDPRREFGGLGR